MLPGPGAAQSGGQTGAPGQGAASSQDPIADATKVMQALASLKKANIPITDAEVNDALAMAGLPPLQAGTPIPEPLQTEPINVEAKPAQAQGGAP